MHDAVIRRGGRYIQPGLPLNSVAFTILALAELIIGLTNSHSPPIIKDLAADDPRSRCPDVALAEVSRGWSASTPLDFGLKQTIRYFDKLLASGQLD
jgi:UDP-glucuronate decarboxylase